MAEGEDPFYQYSNQNKDVPKNEDKLEMEQCIKLVRALNFLSLFGQIFWAN